MKYLRDGQEHTATVTIEELALDVDRTPPPVTEARGDYGLSLEDVTPALAAHLRLPPGLDGALAAEVARDGAAVRAGLRPGDVVTAINRRAVHDAGTATRELARAEAGQPVFLLIWRRGVELFLQLRRD